MKSEMASKKKLKRKARVPEKGNGRDLFKLNRDGSLRADKEMSLRMKKYNRGFPVKFEAVKTNLRRKAEENKEVNIQFAATQSARAEILLTEEPGYLEPGIGESTYKVTQSRLKQSVDISSAAKRFDLQLQFGPYYIDYLRNGKYLLIAGSQGHVAAFEWFTKKLLCEINVMESVADIKWLHNENMFAVAQKDWVYMYDSQGVELHCLKNLLRVNKMEYLPYHYLLAAATDDGYVTWLDTSVGKIVTANNTFQGRLNVMCQNPYNAVLCFGHAKGTISMWTPNQKKAVCKMLCHKHPVTAISINRTGNYLATASMDKVLKIWDLRNYKCLKNYKLGNIASNLQFSQTDLLGLSFRNNVQVYKDLLTNPKRAPYLVHSVKSSIKSVRFCPFEDVLGFGHGDGFSSILVPGAGEANFDAFESNPFQTKTQRKEAEVKSLLEKIPSELISLDPHEILNVNMDALEEKINAHNSLNYVKPSSIVLKRKQKGKGGSAQMSKRKQIVKQQHKMKFVKEKSQSKKGASEKETNTKNKKSKQPSSVLSRFVKNKS